MKARRALYGAIVTLALLPATADAAPYIDWLPTLERAAIKRWNAAGNMPPCGKPRYVWASSLPGDTSASVDVATCTITWSQPRWSNLVQNPPWLCLVELHEIGHLYGVEHDDGRYSIMRASFTRDIDPLRYPACRESMEGGPYRWRPRR